MTPAQAIASLGGVGWFPVASGTVASGVVVAGYYFCWPMGVAGQGATLAAVVLVGLWAADRAARQSGHDPSYVVIDEMAGMLIACFLVPKSPGALAAAFLLFRLFDIGKWPPMRQLERLPGGWGIMADDVAAGLIARGLLWAGTAALGVL